MGEVTEDAAERFAARRLAGGLATWASPQSAMVLVDLRTVRAAPLSAPVVAHGALGELLGNYCRYLWVERCLSNHTVLDAYEPAARRSWPGGWVKTDWVGSGALSINRTEDSFDELRVGRSKCVGVCRRSAHPGRSPSSMPAGRHGTRSKPSSVVAVAAEVTEEVPASEHRLSEGHHHPTKHEATLALLERGPASSIVAVIPSSVSNLDTRCRPARGVIRPSGAPSTTLRFFFVTLLTRQVPFVWDRGVSFNHHPPR